MDKTDLIVIENILRRMKATAMSQRELAKRSGITHGALNRILRRRGLAGRSTIAAIARAIGCEVEELYKNPATQYQVVDHSPTLLDALRVLSGYQEARDFERAIVLAVLTGRMEYLEHFPEYAKLFRAIRLWKDPPFEPDPDY